MIDIMHFDKTQFVTVSTQRSGSTWLTDMLNSHPDIVSYTELFLRKGEGVPDWGRYRDILYWQTWRRDLQGFERFLRPLGLSRYLDEVYSSHPAAHAVGLKLMYMQIAKWPEIFWYLRSRNVRVIHLVRRNVLDVVLSGMAKNARKVAHAKDRDAIEKVCIHVDPDLLLRRLIKREREQRLFRFVFQKIGIPYIEITYENIVKENKQLDEALKFIGCAPFNLDSSMMKLNPNSHRDLIDNFSSVSEKLQNTVFYKMLRW